MPGFSCGVVALWRCGCASLGVSTKLVFRALRGASNNVES